MTQVDNPWHPHAYGVRERSLCGPAHLPLLPRGRVPIARTSRSPLPLVLPTAFDAVHIHRLHRRIAFGASLSAALYHATKCSAQFCHNCVESSPGGLSLVHEDHQCSCWKVLKCAPENIMTRVQDNDANSLQKYKSRAGLEM